MKKRLHIVATCADRKLVPVPNERRLRSYRSLPSVSRFESFVRALRDAAGEHRAARDLYAGPYWSVVRDLPNVAAAAGVEARLWVASAGYGLVPGDAVLQGYSATFRSGTPDSVPTRTDPEPLPKQLTAWWNSLSAWHGPSRGSPRSLHRLAKTEGETIVILASPRYVQAMADDLRLAAEVLGDQLLIVTSHDPGPDDVLAAHIVPSQESLIGHVAGARPALHARVARHMLEHAREHPLSARSLRARYTRLGNTSDYVRPPVREPMTDTEVRHFIRRELGADPNLTHSGLLRFLRNGGRACEQKRFRNLFREEAGNAR